MTDEELIQKLRSGESFSTDSIEEMLNSTKSSQKSKYLPNLLQEIFGNNIKFNIINLDDFTENIKNVTKEKSSKNNIQELVDTIIKASTQQEHIEETNKTSNDEYFFKELETAKKDILEARSLDKKTILFSKERENLQSAILEYCHKKDWSSTIKFTLSKEIAIANLKDEFLKSVCEEFGLKLLDTKTRSLQDVEFELKIDLEN